MNAITQMRQPDWEPRSEKVLSDQIKAYDTMRRRCPVAYSNYLDWSLFRHEDIMRVLGDYHTFSNVVSTHPSIPNGLDPPQHTAYRQLIERHFAPDRVKAFEPRCRTISGDLISRLPRDEPIDLVTQLAQLFAVHIQCAFLSWPANLHEPLLSWVRKNHEATLAGDRKAMAAIAVEFDGHITQLLETRRGSAEIAPEDITANLLQERIGDRLLSHEELVSILRNWTVGELGTITACVGILFHYLAENQQVQQRLRQDWQLLPTAIDEILRIHAPLVANRRVTTKPVEIGQRRIAANERITLIWASANRDEAVFGNPDEFRLDRDPALNLLYGYGIHACPGAQLARLELCVLMEEFLRRTHQITLVPGCFPTVAIYPASGFRSLPVHVS